MTTLHSSECDKLRELLSSGHVELRLSKRKMERAVQTMAAALADFVEASMRHYEAIEKIGLVLDRCNRGQPPDA